MKNSIKTFICAFALVTSVAFSASAEDKEVKKSTGFGTGIYASKTGKINVLVDKGNTGANTTLLLQNDRGDVVYRETVEKNMQKFGRILNVDELEPGNYQIKVISNGETQSRTFRLTEQKTERTLSIR